MSLQSVALFPAGHHENQSGGRDGLVAPLAISELRAVIPTHSFDAAKLHYSDSDIPFRAVIRRHLPKWSKLGRGDRALFYSHGSYYASAQIVFTGQWPKLGESIFGDNRTHKGELWELFCFFDVDWKPLNIPVTVVNEALGYESERPLFGFTVIKDAEKVARVKQIIESPVYSR